MARVFTHETAPPGNIWVPESTRSFSVTGDIKATKAPKGLLANVVGRFLDTCINNQNGWRFEEVLGKSDFIAVVITHPDRKEKYPLPPYNNDAFKLDQAITASSLMRTGPLAFRTQAVNEVLSQGNMRTEGDSILGQHNTIQIDEPSREIGHPREVTEYFQHGVVLVTMQIGSFDADLQRAQDNTNRQLAGVHRAIAEKMHRSEYLRKVGAERVADLRAHILDNPKPLTFG